ncbi:MAG: radical SAM protein [Ruminococcaceae bacterium]|nr:radical SAM protein [Oscillospiraceae bacterium]
MMLKKVYLEITNVCNCSCAFCPGHKRPKAFMDLAHFAYAAKQVKTVSDFIYLHVMGEPLLHPKLAELLGICEEIGLKVIITTNGTLLKEKLDILLSQKALHKINISLHSFEANDGMQDESYFENCFFSARETASGGIITVLRLWNLDGELPGMHRENEYILDKMKKALPGKWTQNSKGVRISEKLFLEWGNRFTWPDLSRAPLRQNGSCYGLRDQAGILVDGTVVPCCLDCNGDIALGNVFDMPLAEILNTKRAVELREGFKKQCYTEPLCKTCGYAGRFSSQK